MSRIGGHSSPYKRCYYKGVKLDDRRVGCAHRQKKLKLMTLTYKLLMFQILNKDLCTIGIDIFLELKYLDAGTNAKLLLLNRVKL